MRCIGSILFVFCYLALGNELSYLQVLEAAVMIVSQEIHGEKPFPENQRGSARKNSPSWNTIFPPMTTIVGKRAK